MKTKSCQQSKVVAICNLQTIVVLPLPLGVRVLCWCLTRATFLAVGEVMQRFKTIVENLAKTAKMVTVLNK